jgi:hypothetical protein
MGGVRITNFFLKWSFVRKIHLKNGSGQWEFSNCVLLVVFRVEKVGIPEFLNGIGNGVEAHVAKLESEIGDFQKLLVTRTLRLKKLGIPVKQVIQRKSTSFTLWTHNSTIIDIEVFFFLCNSSSRNRIYTFAAILWYP